MPKPTLAQLEAHVTRQHLAAAPGTKDRCYTALMLAAIRSCRREQENGGGVVTEATTGETSPAQARVTLSPVGASSEASALSVTPDDSRSDIRRIESPLLGSLPLSPENPAGVVTPTNTMPARRQGQRA